MVVGEASINNIMGGIESTGGVRLHNHKKKLKQRFDIIKKLGQGTYGKVQLGINKETGQEVAIKTIKKSKIETEADLIRIRREIQIMSSVQHPNIIHIYEVFENREKMVLVMEYAAGGELYDYLSERKVLAEEEARRIFRQIATACYYCHKHKICHRDLKLENILLDENGNAKIADFGLSNVFDGQRLLSTFCGSPLYASPEIVKGTPYHGPEVDCWSLGVLLYTLVYGAMPFDGSNFKRLVKQISQGDYFEPKKPSPASPLIREMLTVNPRNRANISTICAHWWVNETYEESCLDISEELANLTPVRLDLLLSLAPPPPQLESEKLVVTGDVPDETMKESIVAPTRSQSVGSLMELQTPAERRIHNMIADELKTPSKRKLETTISTDQANILNDGKRKEKINKENTVADISVRSKQALLNEDATASEGTPLDRSRTQTLSKEMEVEDTNEAAVDPQLQGAACAEILEEAKKSDVKKPVAKTKTLTSSNLATALEDINENPSQENLCTTTNLDKENIKEKEKVVEKEQENKTPTKKKVVKKVLGVKNENGVEKEKKEEPVSLQTVLQKTDTPASINNKEPTTINDTNKTDISDEAPTKPIERRRSKIFEQAEKFQNMITANESKTNVVPEKPKKLVIPGVSVGGFKKEFERKASLTSTSPPKLKPTLTKKSYSVDKTKASEQEKPIEKVSEEKVIEQPEHYKPDTSEEDDRKLKLKNAVNIISQALDKEGTRKSKSRPCMRKPPVPFGASGRSASGSIGMITSPLSPPPDRMPLHLQDSVRQKLERSLPEQVKCEQEPEVENKTSNAEITLKSATLPRRKTAKAQIELVQPKVPTTMGFKTEMAHHIEAAPQQQQQQPPQPKLTTQRSEVIFPVSSPTHVDYRASSLEPEQMKTKERIIPISVDQNTNERRENVTSPPAKPPTPRLFQTQKSNTPQKSSNNLSRQSTQESDLESNGEPIKKSPREYIIPIAVEGGGYVTPRAGSLEPSETSSTTSTMTNNSRRLNKYGRALRMNSLLSDRDGSEDESPFGALHRHSSFGKDSDTEDSRKDVFHMHRLRSSRPKKISLEHNDSVSSGEDDDDDGFEILTAENLFSTLLSRVRDLTQRLNVDGRPGFPSSRLLSHFGHETDFFNNMHSRMNTRNSPLGRTFNRERNTSSTGSYTGVPWRRSVSRDLGTDIDRVFNEESPNTPLHTSTLPRGDNNNIEKSENLNLSDLDLKKLKLTEEDALALSYLTPGLSRRIQRQLLAQLPPSEAKKLTRTLSMRNTLDKNNQIDKSSDRKRDDVNNYGRYSVDRIFSSTLPRKYSIDSASGNSLKDDKQIKEIRNIRSRETTPIRNEKTCLPVKSNSRTERYQQQQQQQQRNTKTESLQPTARFENFDSKLENLQNRSDKYQTKSDCHEPPIQRESSLSKIRAVRSSSLREPNVTMKRDYLIKSPDLTDNNNYSFKESQSASSASPNKRDEIGTDYGSTRYNLYGSRTSLATTPEPSLKTDKKLELKQPSRKVSRFLRPDFFDNKEENIVQKEKKEREMETQQVLKEIRDKRVKNKLNLRRERSASRDTTLDSIKLPISNDKVDSLKLLTNNNGIKHEKNCNDSKNICSEKNVDTSKNVGTVNAEESKNGNTVVCDNNEISSIEETNATIIHDYVNVPKAQDVANKLIKPKTSKLMRPKSYPFEGNNNNNKTSTKIKAPTATNVPSTSSPDKDSNKNTIGQIDKNKLTEKVPSKSPENDTCKSPEKDSCKSPEKDSCKSPERDTCKSPEKDSCKSPERDTCKSPEKDSCKSPERDTCKSPEKDSCKSSGKETNKSSEKSKVKVKKSVPTEKSKLKSPEPDGVKSNKNKFLQSLEKQIGKLRSFSVVQNGDEKKSAVKSAINKLREQSLPRNLEHCSTESGLIKRAVSVEDVTTIDTKNLQPSRKSVTKILNLFKKYEDNEDNSKKLKNKKKSETVEKSNGERVQNCKTQTLERPKSLSLDKTKCHMYNAKSEGINKLDLPSKSELNVSKSKLPVNSFRKSFNLDDSKFNRLKVNESTRSEPVDFLKQYEPYHSTNENRYSTTTDDSSLILSPCDDNLSCSSWSVGSSHHDRTSPTSYGLSHQHHPHLYSGDESESVIDRIRRKSFYSRFNEKKRTRKPSTSSSSTGNVTGTYKDLDLYKDHKSSYRNNDYGSLDRRSVDYRTLNRRSSYDTIDPTKKDYKGYTRCSSLLNDGYVNVPHQRYDTYNPRKMKQISSSSLYGGDNKERHTLDDIPATEKFTKYSYQTLPSRSRLNTNDYDVIPSQNHTDISATNHQD